MLYQSGYSRMLSNIKIALGFTLLCALGAGGAGYAALPDMPLKSSDASTGNPAPGSGLQAEYPPEPGAPRDRGERILPPPIAGSPRPGTSYGAPDPGAPRSPHYPAPADLPPDVAASTGPRGTSGESQRYDTVGYASWYGEEMQNAPTASGQMFDANAITAAHRTLPLGSIVEVTALDTGRTILALINDRGPTPRDLEIDLSRGAAQLLGITATAPVRVRLVTATPLDVTALRSGQAAAPRIDAPKALLTALRHQLPPRAIRVAAPLAPPVAASRTERVSRPAVIAPQGPAATPSVPSTAAIPAHGTSGTFVQVAALSNEGRAKALATTLRGRVQRVGAIYRIQIGPYANGASAKAARDDVARRGYGDARIVQTN